MSKRKIEVYYSKKSKTVYVMMPNGNAYFVTNDGHVGQTTGQRGVTIGNGPYSGQSTFENARLVCELTPSNIRKVNKLLGGNHG